MIKPPNLLLATYTKPVVFLAGSIEMGQASFWRERVVAALADLDLILLNPRRDAWDSSWAQSIESEPFRQQVEWELQGQELSHHILLHFEPQTKAPISLLELGLFAGSGKLIVSCPDGFWRQGNVEIVCRRYGCPYFTDLDTAVAHLRRQV